MKPGTVLVINCGSSSIKYSLVDPVRGDAVAEGKIQRIGEEVSHLEHTAGGRTQDTHHRVADHGEGLRSVLRAFEDVGPDLAEAGVVAVGHRVVQGGQTFDGPVVVDDAVLARIDELSPLAPLHNPPNVRGIEVARELLPHVPHVAVFDTAFFQALPDYSATYALDRETARRYRVRRYGAHGTSHQYVSRATAELLGRPLETLRQVVLHLGNGASATAVVGGRPVDTSMGLTPLEGLVMGTRTGDIDPAVVFHLYRNAGMSVDEIDDLFNKRSGLKGLTGYNDVREIHELADAGDADATLALEVVYHRLRKYIGAYAAAMGGVDAIAFTAGIGENDPVLRANAVSTLEFLGVRVDPRRNEERSGHARVISTADSAVAVLVVPTDEELEIARQTVSLL